MNNEPEPEEIDPARLEQLKQNLPDGLKPPAERVLTREQIEKRVRARHGIEKDELDVLFPHTPQGEIELTAFYNDTVMKLNQLDGGLDDLPTDQDELVTDSYKLSKTEKLALKDIELSEERKARQKKKAKTEIKQLKKAAQEVLESPEVKQVVEQAEQVERKAAFEAAGAHLPPEDQVSYEDMQSSLQDLLAKGRQRKTK